ncbi:hypothetical protein C8J57DRAFT_1231925 [Mycena rebaudengoi]|nr:hypothetical protein C8J57DRAFT_1231925 [Mycena rebaudengoi]
MHTLQQVQDVEITAARTCNVLTREWNVDGRAWIHDVDTLHSADYMYQQTSVAPRACRMKDDVDVAANGRVHNPVSRVANSRLLGLLGVCGVVISGLALQRRFAGVGRSVRAGEARKGIRRLAGDTVEAREVLRTRRERKTPQEWTRGGWCRTAPWLRAVEGGDGVGVGPVLRRELVRALPLLGDVTVELVLQRGLLACGRRRRDILWILADTHILCAAIRGSSSTQPAAVRLKVQLNVLQLSQFPELPRLDWRCRLCRKETPRASTQKQYKVGFIIEAAQFRY